MVDLDTLKNVLRGLVVSNPGVTTIETLCRDYRTSEGHELPYRQLGYRSSGEFLSDLRDTLKISGNTVCVVSSKETAHLESLVARQRKGKNRGKLGSVFYGKTAPSRQYLTPKYQPLPTNYSSNYGSSPRCSSYGSNSNTRNRYSSSQSFQKRDDKPRTGSNLKNEETHSSSPEANQRPIRYYEEESDYDSEDDHYDEFEVVTPSIDKHSDYVSNEDVEDPLSDSVRNTLYETGASSRATVEDYVPSDDDDDSISPKMKKNLKEIIEMYPSGLRCARLPEEYMRRFGVPLDCRQCGYVSVNQMAMALPGVFRCVPINSGDWMLFDAEQPPPEQFMYSANDDESASQVSGKVLERISSILSLNCRGVTLNDFSVNYMILYGSPVMDEVEGYDTMEDLFRSLNNTILVVKEVNGEIMVYPPSGEGDDPNDSALPVKLTWEEIRSTLPPTACKPEDKCPQISLPKDIEFGKYIIVRLGETYSPWKFWVHLYGREFSDALDKLMDSMQSFYLRNKRKYFVPLAHWKRGQHCVAIYENEWHRAVILSIVDKDSVKVKYFDYGTIDTVRKTDLRLLDKQFSRLPMMAIKAKLSPIKPAKGRKVWSNEANQFFFKLIEKKRLVASVIRAVHSPPFLALALVDTEGGEDVHINDELVEHGFAEYSSVESNNEWSDEPDEPDYVDVDDGADKWQTETNKSSEPTRREKGVTEEASATAVSNSINLLDKNNTSSGATFLEMVPAVSSTQAAICPPPGISTSVKACRPPPGFKALDPARLKAPPGLAPQGQNLYYTQPPLNAGLANINQNALYANMVNSMPFNNAGFSNNGLQLPQLNGYNPIATQQWQQLQQIQQVQQLQRLMAMRPNPPPMQQWPVNTANPWDPAFNGNPYNQYMYRPPVASNNPAFPPQYPRQPNWSHTTKPADLKPTNSTLSKSNFPKTPERTDVVKKQKESDPETLTSVKNFLKIVDLETTALSLLDDVTTALSCPSEKSTSKTPSPPLSPPCLTFPLIPSLSLEEKGEEVGEAEIIRLSADLSRISTAEETLPSENSSQKIDGGCHQSESTLVATPQTVADNREVIESHEVREPENQMNTCEVAQQEQRTLPKRLWKPLDVTVGVVHLLNYEGEAYVSSDELARVCLQKNCHRDFAEIARSTIHKDTFFEFSRHDHEEFFSSLDLCPGLREVMCSEGELKLTFIPLKKVVSALIAGGIKVPEVVFAFQNARSSFNPDDEYWRQDCENLAFSSN